MSVQKMAMAIGVIIAVVLVFVYSEVRTPQVPGTPTPIVTQPASPEKIVFAADGKTSPEAASGSPAAKSPTPAPVVKVTETPAAAETPAVTETPAADTPAPDNPAGPKPFMLGKVAIFLKEKRIELNGKINIRQNVLELLACTESGRAYESLTILDCAPKDLQAALILLGLEFHGGPQYLGDPTPPKGDPLRLYIEWKDDKGKVQRKNIESMVLDKRINGAMKPIEWVFSGSRWVKDEGSGKDVFGAENSGTLITTYHDPDAIIDNPLKEGGVDENWEAKTDAIPAESTPIKFIIQSVKHLKQEPKKDKPADDVQK